MTTASETRLAAIGRAAPVDSAAAIGSAILFGVAATRPELFDRIPPETAIACLTGVFSAVATIRAWWRGRRRIRESRRAARQARRDDG